MAMYEATTANVIKIEAVAQCLCGSCYSLEEGLATQFGEDADVSDFSVELLRELDDRVMCCEGCNWWCDAGDLDEDQLCSDCCDEEGKA